MPSISGPSLLAVQTYATQTAAPARPSGPVDRTAATARAEAGSAFSVALSEAATKALNGAAASDAAFRPFVSAADMGARQATPGAPAAADPAPRPSPAGAPARHQRPGTHLDIKV